MLFEAGCDGSEVFEFIEEALDAIAISIKVGTEGWDVDAPRHRLDVGPDSPVGQLLAKGIAVVSAIGQQDLSGPEGVEHVLCAAPVMGLALSQLEHDRQTTGIDQGMDLGGQAAP